MADPFVHLHVHTEYSMLDGYQQHKELAAHVAELGQPAVAMTDHGNLFGAFSFYHAMTKAGIKPIIGIEAYVAPSSRFNRTQEFWDPRGKRSRKDRDTDEGESKDIAGGGRFTHLTLLAKDAIGLRQLYELAGRASLEGQYPRGKARMDRHLFEEVIGRDGQHLIASTGCPSSEVQTRLRLGQYEQARTAAGYYRDLFGAENYFVEVMDHGLAFEKQARTGLLKIGRELGIAPLATNDAHYVRADQAHGHDCLLAIGTGNFLTDTDRLKFAGGYYIKSDAEMRALFDVEVPGACDNTLLVADMVGSYEQMFAFRDRMPHPSVPDGFTEESYLRHLVELGLAKRYGALVPAQARERADYELSVILPLGFAGYFIMVFLLCGFMREQGIRFGPRGSAAGSIVVYALEIADMDPLRHKLMFERFMNPERISPPDVDLDIDERRREEVVAYVVRTYGEAYVSQIITFGRMKTRESIDDAARITQSPIPAAKRLKDTIPPDAAGFGVTFGEIFDENHPRYDEGKAFRELIARDPEAPEIFTTARLVEGRVRKTGKHPCGLIVSSEPLLGQIPIWLDIPKDADAKKGKVAALLAGHEYPDLEALGLQKMDLLGLRNWTVIDDTIKAVERAHGVHIDTEQLNGFDDPGVYEMLARGESVGVFQMEGSGITALLRLMKPTCFEDIMAVGALYRPGPMGMKSHENYALRKNGLQDVTPIHPQLEDPLRDVLAPTYGVICYQEQVIDAAMIVAGYTRGQADLLRKVMGKKKKDLLAREYEPFNAAMRARDYCQEAVDALWNTLVPFAEYAFNRAHTACYGRLAYVTAWLKLRYPAEYLAALLTSVADDKDKAAIYLAECRRIGIRVLPPDVNESTGPFTPAGEHIRFGLAAVRNLGSGVVDTIVRGRSSHGPYRDFYDFLATVEPAACAKRPVESLIKAGAFDSLNHPRHALHDVHVTAVEAHQELKRRQATGQYDLFSGFGDEQATTVMPAIGSQEWSKRDKLSFEREMLGLYVSDHPLTGLETGLSRVADTTMAELLGDEAPDGRTVTVAGILTGTQHLIARGSGKPWAKATLEDLTGGVPTLFFPALYELVSRHLADDTIVVVKARVRRNEDELSLHAIDLALPDLQAQPLITLTIPVERCTKALVAALQEVFWEHPGTAEIRVRLVGDARSTLYRLGVRAAPTEVLAATLTAITGPGAVELVPPRAAL